MAAPDRGQGRRSGRQNDVQPIVPPAANRARTSWSPGEFYPDEETLTEEEALQSVGPLPGLRRVLRVPGVRGDLPGRLHPPGHAGRGDRRPRSDAVIVATGYTLFPAELKPQYGFGKYKNVITGMQMDRLLAPTRPFNGVVRPGDGKVPDNIAYILCTGSRDETLAIRCARASAACTPSSRTS